MFPAPITRKIERFNIEKWQSNNRKVIVAMLPLMLIGLLLGALLLGLIQVLRLEPSRKRLSL